MSRRMAPSGNSLYGKISPDSNAVATLFPIATAAFGSSFLIIGLTDIKKNSDKCKEILLFASALVFEEHYISDFVNAE